jgi:hypothetical protein
MRDYRTFLCGGYYERRQPRGDCPSTLHDWPLPSGYVEASEVADARLRARWANKKCPECGLYGWAPGNKRAGTHPVQVQLETKP